MLIAVSGTLGGSGIWSGQRSGGPPETAETVDSERRSQAPDGSVARQRMQVAHHCAGALVENVRVDLRGRNISVAKQFLHDSQIRAVLQQVAREGVPQDVRADEIGAQARSRRGGLQVAGEHLPGQVAALAV